MMSDRAMKRYPPYLLICVVAGSAIGWMTPELHTPPAGMALVGAFWGFWVGLAVDIVMSLRRQNLQRQQPSTANRSAGPFDP
jgi:hypothetical protein